MLVQTFQKPKYKKQTKAKNNPRPTEQDICEKCGRPYAALHEVFYGRGKRQLSIKYKMQIRLCYRHHEDTKSGIHHDKRLDLQTKKEYQKRFEKIYGHDVFMKVFCKDYLDLTLEEYTKSKVVVA